ncbi:MAG: UDP-N-acetylmuramate--L-alanine ligase [Ignavibacteria bacterium]
MSEETDIFEGVRKVHLIGVGGIGMSGIAEYLARKKYIVSGSDLTKSLITKRLTKFGVLISEGHVEMNLPDDAELVIYTSAVTEDNPEFLKAKKTNKKLVKRAEALGNIVNNKFVIAVSGTHGKTTTSAMIAKILIDNKFDPTVFIGGNLDFLDGGSSRIGNSDIAVVEADEYDRSFHQLKSDIIVITNIDSDHLDIYKDINEIKDSFKKFVNNAKKNLLVIACGDDENVIEVLKDVKNKYTYGFKKENDYSIEDITFGKKAVSFILDNNEIRLRVLGKHNILNSSAAFLAAKKLMIGDDRFNESIKSFYGVKRRLELKLSNEILVYDDYAHHPTEVEVTLDALRKNNKGRIITVFQPHLYTRTRDLYREFGKAFAGSDLLYLAKIYPAREKVIEGITSELILTEYKKSGKEGWYFEDNNALLDELESIKRPGDIIIFQGAGDIIDLCEVFVNRIKIKTNGKVPL